MDFSYRKICKNLLRKLPERAREVISRRYNLDLVSSPWDKRETLESVGKSFKICRERVRQIERGAMNKLNSLFETEKSLSSFLFNNVKSLGGVAREDSILNSLGKEKDKPCVYLLLNLNSKLQRFEGSDSFHAFYSVSEDAAESAKKAINVFNEKLKKENKPLEADKNLVNYLSISKKIKQNDEGLYGLTDWPEINPKRIRDKAYLAMKREKKPLHFREVAACISPSALAQTVHNELIRDSRFVLVGRGLYALKEWGYVEGVVKDVISNILKSEQKPLSKDKIIEKVMKQRFVKESTVLLNLNDRKYFLRTEDGNYTIRQG